MCEPMRLVAVRSLIFASVTALALAGCQTDGSFDFFGMNEQPAPNANAAFDQPPAPQATSYGEQDAPPPAQEQQPVYNNPLNNTPRGEALTETIRPTTSSSARSIIANRISVSPNVTSAARSKRHRATPRHGWG